jgi:Lysozyme like domain
VANLSYAQLKGVWLTAAKGTKYDTDAWATLMAAIAEAESRGDPSATNPTDNNGAQTSWGLWQISLGNHTAPSPHWADPVTNAKLAIGKLNGQGLKAWGTYNSGAYKAFLSGKTSADLNIPAGPSAVTTAAITTATQSDAKCAWSVGWGGIPGTSWLDAIFGGGGNVGSGEICLLSKSQARAIMAVNIIAAGTAVILFVGVPILAAAGTLKIGVDLAGLVIGRGAGGAARGAAAESGTAAASAGTAPAAEVADSRGTSPQFRKRYGLTS